MWNVRGPRFLGLTAAGVVAIAAMVTATFTAPRPGADLQPEAGATEVVSILQGRRSLVWTALAGPVLFYRVEGWPTVVDGNELGGAVVLERPPDPSAGSIALPEQPRTVSFEVGS